LHDLIPVLLLFLHSALPQLLDERQWVGEVTQGEVGEEKIEGRGDSTDSHRQVNHHGDVHKESTRESASMAAMTADTSTPGLAAQQQQVPAINHAGVSSSAAGIDAVAVEFLTATQMTTEPAPAFAAFAAPAAPGHPRFGTPTSSSFTAHSVPTLFHSSTLIGLTLSRSGTALASTVQPLVPSTGCTPLTDMGSTISSTPQTGAGGTMQAETGSTVPVPDGTALAVMEGTGVGLSISRTSTLLVQHQELGDGEWVEVGESHHRVMSFSFFSTHFGSGNYDMT
jgi:hypothetical protein